METRTKLVAVEFIGNKCSKAFVVKNLTEVEYHKLLNESLEFQAKDNELKDGLIRDIAKLHNRTRNLALFIAVGVYDNLVDRGLIEEDKVFDQKWHDFIINGTPVDEYPPLVLDIAERLGM